MEIATHFFYPSLFLCTSSDSLQYGLTWAVQGLVGPLTFFCMDPADVEHILKTNFENYEKG